MCVFIQWGAAALCYIYTLDDEYNTVHVIKYVQHVQLIK